MAARLISPEDVAQACNELVRAGEQPSTLKVRKRLGKGSPNTIQKFIKQWSDSEEAQNAKAEQLPAVVNLPQEFQEESELLLKKIFKLAEQEQAAKVEQVRQERDQAVAKAEAEAQDSLDYANGIDEDNAVLKDQLKDLDNKVATLEEEIGRQKASNDELSRTNARINQELSDALAHIEALSKAVSGLETDKSLLEQERNSAKDVLVKAQKKHETDITALKGEHRDAIKARQLEHSDEIKALKADHKETIKELKVEYTASSAALKKAHDKAVSDLTKANDKTVATLESGLQDAQKQRDSASAAAAKLETDLATSTAKIATQEAEIAKLKTAKPKSK